MYVRACVLLSAWNLSRGGMGGVGREAGGVRDNQRSCA